MTVLKVRAVMWLSQGYTVILAESELDFRSLSGQASNFLILWPCMMITLQYRLQLKGSRGPQVQCKCQQAFWQVVWSLTTERLFWFLWKHTFLEKALAEPCCSIHWTFKGRRWCEKKSEVERGENRREIESKREESKARRKSMPHCKQVGAAVVMNIYRAAA